MIVHHNFSFQLQHLQMQLRQYTMAYQQSDSRKQELVCYDSIILTNFEVAIGASKTA